MFGVVDYIMLGLTVAVSLLIGLYQAKGNNTPEDFVIGSRNMKPFPVSLSLLATFISANIILGEKCTRSSDIYGNF